MNILVTGATGFAGGYILKYLKDQFPEASISGTSRSREKSESLSKLGFNIIVGDLSDPDFVKSELSGFTHIVHSAARSSIWGKRDIFIRDNVTVTRNLLSEIDKLERFIYISSANIYFNFTDRTNILESDTLPENYRSYYPETKLLAENDVLNFNKKKIHRISLRPRGIIGPGDTTSMPKIVKAYNSKRIRIVGDGNNIIDFTSVENLAHAVKLSISASPETDGEAFNITDGETFQFWEALTSTMLALGKKKEIKNLNYRLVYLMALLSEKYAMVTGGNEPSLTRYAVGVMNSSFTLNIDKARSILGYEPVITSEQSIRQFIEWYKADK